jgi:hypothetical protein
VQRVDTKAKLFARGQKVADYFRDRIEDDGLEHVCADIGKDCPLLFDLLLEAFPKSP